MAGFNNFTKYIATVYPHLLNYLGTLLYFVKNTSMATSIKCPNCATELDVENMLSADAEEKLKRQYEQQWQQSLSRLDSEKQKLVQEQKLLEDIKAMYDRQNSPYYAAARMWVDGIIDPAETRKIISESLNAANHNPNMENFQTGVFQV